MAKHLIAILGMGKGSWGHIARLIAETDWQSITLMANDWGKEHFKPSKEVNWVMVNNRAGFEILKTEIRTHLPKGEIAVSLISGSGKEHMAIIAALRENKQAYEIVLLTGQGVQYY